MAGDKDLILTCATSWTGKCRGAFAKAETSCVEPMTNATPALRT